MAPEPAAPEVLDDRWLRAIGIPAFGIAIPLLAGLYGPYGPGDAVTWVGAAGFVALSWSIWMGNRWLLFSQRRRYTWWAHPWRRLALLVTGVVLYTAPITVGALGLWYVAAGLPVDGDRIVQVALANTVCVLVVAHLYETLFLVRERIDDATRVERLERARAVAQLAALRQQVDPHFLFNALNTLAWLIETDPGAASTYVEALADVYRYVLRNHHRDLVQLDDELAFVQSYVRLLRLRFGDALAVATEGEGQDWLVPPISVQVLVENAVKHNRFGRAHPLAVTVRVEGDTLVVGNPRRPRTEPQPSAGTGLANLAERVELATRRSLRIDAAADRFEVHLPLMALRGVGR